MISEPTHDLPSLSSPEVRTQREVMRQCNEDIRRCYNDMFSGTRSMLTLEEAALSLGIGVNALRFRLRRNPSLIPVTTKRVPGFPRPMTCFARSDVEAYRKTPHYRILQHRAWMHDHRDSWPMS